MSDQPTTKRTTRNHGQRLDELERAVGKLLRSKADTPPLPADVAIEVEQLWSALVYVLWSLFFIGLALLLHLLSS